ncbi:MAG TPA: GNAT family N-acetyltransferase [Burkholderiaceae bacterium]|nr:GNAT family N-acetyltransferase [Burkholderiaceae bacterium]
MPNTTSINVRHNPQAQRFEAIIDGHPPCVCDYRLQDGGVLALVHTEVPAALEGRGIASALVQSAFEYAQEKNLVVRPLCSYVRVWVKRHPQVQALVRND